MQIPTFIRRLAKCCDPSVTRYALGGIKCESDGTTARLTATDGRILACVHWRDKDSIPMDVLADAKQLSSPPAKAFKHKLGVRFDGESFRAGASGTVEAKDGKYPDYERIFTIHDEPEGYVAVKLDAALLGKLCDLSRDMNDDQHKGKGITLFVKDAQSCVFGTTAGEDGHVARFAIMPLAHDDPDAKYTFPARPAAESVAEDDEPAPPPEVLDDDEIADAVTSEPEPVAAGYCDLAPI